MLRANPSIFGETVNPGPDTGFAPVARRDARVLILGSMPSRQSLDQQQYYGNPHNAFWRIVSDYSDVPALAPYEERVQGVLDAGIAIWDVIKTCVRPGSLDASIESASIEVNAFNDFFTKHSGVHAIFLNGGKAAQEYRRRVLPMLLPSFQKLVTTTLLSTSPANARYTLDEKKTDWAQIRPWLEAM